MDYEGWMTSLDFTFSSIIPNSKFLILKKFTKTERIKNSHPNSKIKANVILEL